MMWLVVSTGPLKPAIAQTLATLQVARRLTEIMRDTHRSGAAAAAGAEAKAAAAGAAGAAAAGPGSRVTRYPISIWRMTVSILSSPISSDHIPYRYPEDQCYITISTSHIRYRYSISHIDIPIDIPLMSISHIDLPY
jgi:hypothetical protein